MTTTSDDARNATSERILMSATDPSTGRVSVTDAAKLIDIVVGLRAERDKAIAERDRAIETRENANAVSIRLQGEVAHLRREWDTLYDQIERALGAMREPKATNWERLQAAGLILTEGQEI